MNRGVLRHPDLVELNSRAYDIISSTRFILSRYVGKKVEHSGATAQSEGPYELQLLPLEATRVMREKISALRGAADQALRAQGGPGGDLKMAYIM
jgi:hypothetical protein